MLLCCGMAAGASRLAALLAFVACVAPCAPAAAQAISLETYRQGDAIDVFAEVQLDVDAKLAWDVLSDYDHFAQFIPDMSVSRVVSRTGDTVIVEQKGEFGVLFFHQPVELRLEIVETPRRTIVARAVGGSFREMNGRYDLEEGGGRVKISYAGRFVPAFALPPFLGIIGVRHTAATQLAALVDEIMRRDARAKAPRP
jgi:carbon monoxide dehydrogenase subunit G